jgi:hypothetical protein
MVVTRAQIKHWYCALILINYAFNKAFIFIRKDGKQVQKSMMECGPLGGTMVCTNQLVSQNHVNIQQ